MAEYLVQDTTLTAIADAVRAKKGTTEPIALTDFATEIESIQSGGGSSSNKLALVASPQSEPYDITADDLRGATGLRSYAFMMSTGLNSIEIPNTVTTIQEGAFYYCSGVSSVKFENGSKISVLGSNIFAGMAQNGFDLFLGDNSSLVGIGEYALSDSTIKSIDYGKDSQIQTIGDSAFRNCSQLTAVKIPKTITYLGSSAFYGCSNLKNIEFEDGIFLTEIKSNLFRYCSNLAEITIPDGVTNIGGYAFSGCSGLRDFVIPTGVTSIGERSFEECSGLESITIPASVTSIGTNAFNNCNLLNSVYYEGTFEQWCGITFTSETSNPMYYATNLYINGKLVEGDLIIPSSVNSVGNYAFSHCNGITSVDVSNGTTSIGNSAFAGCSGISSVSFSDNINSVGSYAFKDCTGLTEIVLPKTIVNIGYDCFSGCSNISSLTLSYDSISQKTIGYLFGSTSYSGGVQTEQNRNYYYIPETFKSVVVTDGEIYGYAFSNCNNLVDVSIEEGITTINSSAFSNCTSLTSIVIPDSVTTIGSYAFEGCTGLTSVIFGDNSQLISIGRGAFYGCNNLTEIVLPSNVESIGSSAFMNCYSLSNNILEKNNKLLVVENNTFENCYKLTELTLPKSIASIELAAFYHCYSLKNIYYLGNIQDWCSISFENESSNPMNSTNASVYIGGSTVKGELIIPEGVSNIGDYAFYGVDEITSVILPSSVISVGNNAFKNCYKIAEIYNQSELNIVVSSTDNGRIAEYALSVYSNETESKITTDENGYVVYVDGATRILTDYVGNSIDLIVPNGVTEIKQYAFYNRTDITSIVIPSSVINIGKNAFYGCSKLFTVDNRSSLSISAGSQGYGFIAYYAKAVIANNPVETFVFGADGNQFVVTVKSSGNEIYRSNFDETAILSAIKSVVGEENYGVELTTPAVSLVLTSGETVMPFSKNKNEFSFSAQATHGFASLGIMGYRGADPSNSYLWYFSREGGAETQFGGYGANMPFGLELGVGKYKIFAYATISLTFNGTTYKSVGNSEGFDIEII